VAFYLKAAAHNIRTRREEKETLRDLPPVAYGSWSLSSLTHALYCVGAKLLRLP
jgi:hypothetical protein